MSTLNTVRLADCAELPWEDHGGSNRVLLTWPTAGDWALRLSVARTERDGPLRSFPGLSRSYAVIAGVGVRLRWPSGERDVTPAAPPIDFEGAGPTDCELIDGPTLDLNLMVAPQAGQGRLIIVTPGTPWTSAAPWRGLYAVGPLRLRRPGINPVDAMPGTLLWCDDAANERWQISGGGPAWWIEFLPHEPAGAGEAAA